MKRRKAALCLLMSSVMLLGGCGGQMSDSQGQDSNTASTNSDANAGSDASVDGSVLTIKIAKQLDENTGRYGSGEDINNISEEHTSELQSQR